MSMLPEQFGAEATPHAIEFRGRRYHFQPITFGLMEALEVKHFEQAKQRLRAMKDVLDEDTYAKKGLELYDLYDAGEFGFLSARGQKWIKSPGGAACLIKLCLGIDDAELMPLVLQRGEDIKKLMEVVLREAGLSSGGGNSGPGEGRQEAPFRPHERNL